MVRLTGFGAYSYHLGRRALDEFFLPIIWVATTIKSLIVTRSANRIISPARRQPNSSGERPVVDFFLRNAGSVVALFIIAITVLWYNSQLTRYQREIQALKASEKDLTELADEIFRQIDSFARREGGPADVRLRGCGRVQFEVQCFFEIDAGARFNIFLERGTRFTAKDGTQYFAANSISAKGLSDDQGSVSMGPGGAVVEGPSIFRIRFRAVGPEVDRIALLEILAAEEDGFVVYQFRDIPLARSR